jgi:cation diffusion facilitator CzcD-associated flavoprotein CzcO
MAVTLPNIAIVGTGPTGLYALKSLVQQDSPLVLTLLYVRSAKLAPSPAPARADGGVVRDV